MRKRRKRDIYKCSVCKRRNVKLWRPISEVKPLLCARCAEKRQVGHKQTIDSKGRILVDYWVPDPNGPMGLTKKLRVDLSDVSKNLRNDGVTTMIPAYIRKNGESFYPYADTPKDTEKWWENLPTR